MSNKIILDGVSGLSYLANLKSKETKRQETKSKKQVTKKKEENKEPTKLLTKEKKDQEEEENPYQSVMEKMIQDKKDGKKYQKIKEMSKSELKKKLVELELIKADSKAPVRVLRDIYFFYDMTRMKVQK